MFVLSIIKDTLPIHPSDFGIPAEQALGTEINKKYANRVLHDVGLCVCVFDITEAGEGKVRYGDGYLWYRVVFRMVVFRPFASEIIMAKVKSIDSDGMRLSLGFFDDIYLPASFLPASSAFDTKRRQHFWVPPEFDDEGQEQPPPANLHQVEEDRRMYIEPGEQIRARVESDEFYDDEPGPPKALEGVAVQRVPRRSPYSIICSMGEQGLGPVAWWPSDGGEDAMEEG
ncbi:hypothetical protein HGRIS_010260 [Hohenbuehelia grisea]|uniref:Polymerase III polypeptide H n=1 Tax=Hohenbuehelia grisea TaxID=104357 RepID=A0ABR3J493_9AGAR